MAVVKGTNAGFVSSAPVADPSGTAFFIDTHSEAVKDTSPAGNNKITEIGWWCDNATEETNFEVGLYDHDAGSDKPDNLLYSDTVNAKGTDSGWKTVSVDWAISASTIYWIAVQVDDTATATNCDRNANGADRRSIDTSSTFLPDPWTDGGGGWYDAIYAKHEEATTYSELSGTIAATSTVGPSSLGSTNVELDVATSFIKRVVVVGSNQIWYEDI